ncbi:MAG: hypothetical protein ACFFG0_32170 [Candidatus Thorarchaeota archaeon]
MHKSQILRLFDIFIVVFFVLLLIEITDILIYINPDNYILPIFISCSFLVMCRRIIYKSQIFINKEMVGKQLNNLCLKCGSTEDLVLYSHGKKIAYTCPKCKQDFDTWNRHDILFMFMFFILLIFLIIALFLLYGSVNDDPIPAIIACGILMGFAFIAQGLYRVHSLSEDKPKRHFK